jgi:hypothetical protein
MTAMYKKFLAVVLGVLGLILMQAAAARTAEVMVADEPPQSVTVRNVSISDGAVTGEVVNSSSNPVRDVQLLIRYTWLWKNEMRPGEDTRGNAVFQNVEGELPPGGSKPFKYNPAFPMAAQADGHYEATVKVAGFTQLIPVR